ncbi:MAG: DNA replication/repair protein RecF [Alphaproteobacteria bacterium]|nr:DNA replication/repair protein RecF [Alphaproteobacteria bacterium]
MSAGGQMVQVAAQVKARVAVTRLMLTNFRSYGMLDLKVEAQHVVLTGPNGAGKTNVLEALSMLAPGRGLRSVKLNDLARHLPGDETHRPWAVSATLTVPAGETQLGVGYMPGGDSAGTTKRAVRVDGVTLSNPAQLAERIRLIWLTPAMDRLFIDGVSERRRFLDRLIASFDPAHARRWGAYEIAMRERLSAVRSGAQAAWLTALERTMAEHAVSVAASRLAGVQSLMRAMDEQRASAFPRAIIAVAGDIEGSLLRSPAVEVEDEFAATLGRSRSIDADSGRTSVGPHLTDFVVRHHEKGREAQASSTGEQKALLIRLILASAALPAPGAPEAPVLLLDEIVAHLDETRRRALFDEIEALKIQTWMTGTDVSAFAAFDGRAQFRRVADGQIRPL